MEEIFEYLNEINAVLIDIHALNNILYQRKSGIELDYLTFGLLDGDIDIEKLNLQLVLEDFDSICYLLRNLVYFLELYYCSDNCKF